MSKFPIGSMMNGIRIAVVLPYLHKIEGNKTPLTLISQLIEVGNEVTLFTWKIKSSIYENLKKNNPKMKIEYHKKIKVGKFGIIFAIRYQLLKEIDHKISNIILNQKASSNFDFVIVPSNEGKWIGQYIRKIKTNIRPITFVTIMELHENGMFLHHRSKFHKIVSFFFFPIFFILQQFEIERIKAFDIVSVNSKWTGNSLRYFYGINSDIVMSFYDSDIFKQQVTLKEQKHIEKYIAVPTVSITQKQRDIIQNLVAEGINVIAFGPRKIESENYLGYVTDEKLREILTNASATLFLFDYEAFGLIPLESLICGTPVITEPKLGVYTEYNTCSDVHFAEEYEDIKALCRQFLDSDKTSDSRRRCIDWAEQYNPESVTKKILQAYEKEKMRKSTLKL